MLMTGSKEGLDMDSSKYYVYRIVDRTYHLVPHFKVYRSRIYLTDVLLLDKDGKYLGVWERFNMPVKLVYAVEAWTRKAYSMTIAHMQANLKQTGEFSAAYRG